MDKKEVEKQSTSADGIYSYNNNKLQDQHSIQENKQDLDQQQQVDVKPSQINVQNIDVIVNTKLENYSGKITGIVYRNRQDEVARKVEIYVYFGSEGNYPVYKADVLEGEMYYIEDLPPGFYSIKVVYKNFVIASAHNIKVLPGQISSQPLYLYH